MDIIKKWLKNIKMFDIDFSDRIKHYNSLVKINPMERMHKKSMMK